MEGVIYKGIGGFYYVKTEAAGLVECKPRGIFRKRGQKPLPGDRVRLAREGAAWTMAEIFPRRNALLRPPVANVDQVFVVASTAQPAPGLLAIDKLTACALDLEARPVLVATKTDLAPPNALLAAYAASGIDAIEANAASGQGLADIRRRLAGKLSVFCGNSGVGKSTLLNALAPELGRDVGEISRKLGRGRHTTREVELFEVGGGLLADTPGFASFDLQGAGGILPENMQLCFPEIRARIGQCKYSGCAHVAESGCAVRDAVARGAIAPGRYQSYVALYEEAKLAGRRYP